MDSQKINRDIAIIGMAGRFPDARNTEALYENLRAGKDSQRPLSEARRQATTLPDDREYWNRGYLNQIDEFDHKFFKISLAEAQTMDPHQRQLLEVAYETFENAGLPAEALNGSRTGVFVADKALNYYEHAEEFAETLVTGNNSEFTAARINRHFNLQGSVAVIDTSCSSSLVALHHACNELLMGNAQQALVCGVNLELFPYKDEGYDLELDSPEGISRAFSAEANGMSFGEVVACVLIKPLAQAVADGNNIQAVIKATAVNNNGNRSASLTAPDSKTQAEVIAKAWKKAGIDPAHVGYIEAHGSATQLGDNIEVGGLNQAFANHVAAGQQVPISTIKSNIGHGRCAAGIAGLVKAVLSVKNGELLPTPNYKTPSELIDFDKARVAVNKKLKPWTAPKGQPRIAGVSSIGLSGTNCHVVVQQAPEAAAPQGRTPEEYLFPFSSRTSEGLAANIEAVLDKIRDLEADDLAHISHTLALGRSHHAQKAAVVAANLKDLRQQLKTRALQVTDEEAPQLDKVILVFTDNDLADWALPQYLTAQFPAFEAAYQQCLDACPEAMQANKAFANLAFQYSYYQVLKAKGLASENLLGIGSGKIATRLIKEELTLAQAVQEALSAEPSPLKDLAARIDALVQREAAEQKVLFVAMGPDNDITLGLEQHRSYQQQVFTTSIEPDTPGDPVVQLMATLYNGNYAFDLPAAYADVAGSTIELPTYQFAATRCWLRETPKKAAEAPANEQPDVVVLQNGTPTQRVIHYHWQQVLGHTKFGVDDDFFALGGDSLQATKVINKIKESFDIALDFEDIFEYPTIADLATLIDGEQGTEQILLGFWKEVLKSDEITAQDNFFELGGHSLIANQILNRVKAAFKAELNFEDFFKHPTVAEMAALVDQIMTHGQENVKTANMIR